MLLEALRPGTLKGANGDDQYLAVVQRLGVADHEQRISGDTTDASAQPTGMHQAKGGASLSTRSPEARRTSCSGPSPV
jgi:hypothetical protein